MRKKPRAAHPSRAVWGAQVVGWRPARDHALDHALLGNSWRSRVACGQIERNELAAGGTKKHGTACPACLKVLREAETDSATSSGST